MFGKKQIKDSSTGKNSELKKRAQAATAASTSSGSKKPTASANKKSSAAIATAPADTRTNTTGTNSKKLPSMREVQEQKRKERLEKIAAAKQKVLEQRRIKAQHIKEHQEALRRRHRLSMITFVIGLFVMLTTLICLFPTPFMIVFSTLLMFSFFFLGIAYQRMVMQLLVIALACVFVVSAFYIIVSSM